LSISLASLVGICLPRLVDHHHYSFFPLSSGYKNLKSVTLPPSLTSSLASESSVLATTPYTPPASSLPSSTNFMQSELSLVVGELIFGLGELFGPLAKNGQSLESWNQDGGTSSEQGYKTVPFYLSNRGYGVFINDPGEVAFEVGSEKGAKVGVVTRGETLEYFFMRGPSMKEVLTKYTALTGRPG
jgi:alpha-D-xyloside xylohydrolase